MGTEGLWDMAKETHPHNDVYAHQVDTHQVDAHQSQPDNNLLTETGTVTDGCADQCLDVCHGHFSSILSIDSTAFQLAVNSYNQLVNIHVTALSSAPPTPPPNA